MAGIDADAAAVVAAGELEDEVAEIAEVVEERGGVGLDFLEEGAAVDDLPRGSLMSPSKSVMAVLRMAMRAAVARSRMAVAWLTRSRLRSLTMSDLEKSTLPRRSRSPDFLK